MASFAPVVLFVYNRPQHTQQTLEALAQNTLFKDTILYVYADGAKENATDDEQHKIAAVRSIIHSIKGCKAVHTILREKNYGLAANVIDGVTNIVNQHGSVIVLEDDLLTSPYFLQYCNDGLNTYREVANVYAINAYQFPLGIEEVDTFLCPLGTSSWGWATWANKWQAFEENPSHKMVIQNSTHLSRRFNLADFDYSTMLDNPKSWAIRWYYSVFVRGGLGLFPTQSLVKNIGLDGSGENCGNDDIQQQVHQQPMTIKKKEVINLLYYHLFLEYFSKPSTHHSPSLLKKLINRFRR
ncbi:MAG: hypothetical protein ACFB0B_14235 [Thermonemataceae bacterium]